MPDRPASDEDTSALKREGIINVLLVEDNPGDVRLTQEAFKECADTIRLSVVRDGEEAMDFLHRHGAHVNAPHPNFVLLDLNLPKKNGREVLAEIKQDDSLKRIPVAILTTSKAEEDILRTYELHANCYLAKPVDLEKFICMVKSLEEFWFFGATAGFVAHLVLVCRTGVAAEEVHPMTDSPQRVRVLLVEDNPGDARLIQEMLRESRQVVFEAVHRTTLATGIDMLLVDGADVVLLDLSLPDSLGLPTCQRLRDAQPDVAVIVLTGNDDEAVAMEAVQIGAQDFLVKGDITGPQLERAVRYALERAGALSQMRTTTRELEKALTTITEELDIARLVQHSFLPQGFEGAPGLEISALCLPCTFLGGDLYDVIPVSDTRAALLILDVSGHGVAAALISAMAKLTFDRHIRRGETPDQVMTAVNAELVEFLPSYFYLTAFLCTIDTATGAFTYCAAGHPPALLLQRSTGTVTELKARNSIIGMFEQSVFSSGEQALAPGDTVLMYTDGVIEGRSSQGEQFGRVRLSHVVGGCAGETPEVMVDAVMQEFRVFTANVAPDDDITLFAFRLR